MLLQLQFNITTVAVWCYYHFSLVYCVTTTSVWYYYTSDHCYLKFSLVLHVLSLQFVQCVATTLVWFWYHFGLVLLPLQIIVTSDSVWCCYPLKLSVTTTSNLCYYYFILVLLLIDIGVLGDCSNLLASTLLNW